MKKYISTNEINAKPMNRQDYNDFRGWDLPKDENGADEGYLVEQTTNSKANTEEYKGHVSWFPKEMFEKLYKESDTAKQRVQIELEQLQEKLSKLVLYVDKNNVTDPLLLNQTDVMNAYVDILEQRLGSWEG